MAFKASTFPKWLPKKTRLMGSLETDSHVSNWLLNPLPNFNFTEETGVSQLVVETWCQAEYLSEELVQKEIWFQVSARLLGRLSFEREKILHTILLMYYVTVSLQFGHTGLSHMTRMHFKLASALRQECATSVPPAAAIIHLQWISTYTVCSPEDTDNVLLQKVKGSCYQSRNWNVLYSLRYNNSPN